MVLLYFYGVVGGFQTARCELGNGGDPDSRNQGKLFNLEKLIARLKVTAIVLKNYCISSMLSWRQFLLVIYSLC